MVFWPFIAMLFSAAALTCAWWDNPLSIGYALSYYAMIALGAIAFFLFVARETAGRDRWPASQMVPGCWAAIVTGLLAAAARIWVQSSGYSGYLGPNDIYSSYMTYDWVYFGHIVVMAGAAACYLKTFVPRGSIVEYRRESIGLAVAATGIPALMILVLGMRLTPS